MKLFNPNGSPLMDVNEFKRAGNNFLISGKITMLGAMPLACVLTPSEARSAVRQIGFRNFLFLLTMLFRFGKR